jgi:hypothetical protein
MNFSVAENEEDLPFRVTKRIDNFRFYQKLETNQAVNF